VTDLQGYFVYEGDSPDTLAVVTFTPFDTPNSVLTQLVAGTHYFAISAMNTSHIESALSPIVAGTIPVSPMTPGADLR
jgi:hypothetical protein